jgi:hypothetical protein
MATPPSSQPDRDVVVDINEQHRTTPLLNIPSFDVNVLNSIADTNAVSVSSSTHDGNINATGNPTPTEKIVLAGACAFRELNTGVECGCRAFWKSTTIDGEVKEDCACGHHACFHEQADRISSTALTRTITGGEQMGVAVGREVVAHLQEAGRLLSGFAGYAQDQNLRQDDPALVETIHSTANIGVLDSPALIQKPEAAVSEHVQKAPEGLGLMLRNDSDVRRPSAADDPRQSQSQAPSSIDSENVARALQRFLNSSPVSWGRPAEILNRDAANDKAEASEPSQGQQAFQLLTPLAMTDYRSIPGFEDMLHSATELATPSIGYQTPDLDIPSAIMRPRRQQTSPSRGPTDNDNGRSVMPPPDAIVRQGTPRLTRGMLTPSSQALSPPPFILQDPSSLAQLAHHLSVLNKFVSNHGSQLRGLLGRVETVERSSFFSQPGVPVEFNDKLDHIEARVIEVETKVDDHTKALWRGDSDSSMDARSRRHGDLNSLDGSSLDGQIAQSIETRVAAIEDRLLGIEKSLPPSLNNPYKIEVVLLPWGRNLRGIWIEDRDLGSRYNTQDSEDWANSRSVQPLSTSRFSAMSNAEPSGNVWDRQSIYDWAENTVEWLVPRACGIKSVAYHRLKSRGFVRTVEWTRPGAREVHDAIIKAFGDVFSHVNHLDPDEVEDAELDEKGKNFLGLQAQFIPLRKVRGSSRLCFLAQSEMVTSALWTAEFLASSVVMKAPGGLRRLFITERESYLQRPSRDEHGCTWAKLKDMPRYPPGSTSNESYWVYHQVLDAPLSLHSSFASQDSDHMQDMEVQKARSSRSSRLQSPIKMRSEERHTREASAKASFVPITPATNASQDFNTRSVSEFPFPSTVPTGLNIAGANSRYYLRRHGRTVSGPQFGQTGSASSGAQSFRQGLEPQAQIRSFSASMAGGAAVPSGSGAKRSRGFDSSNNPLINSIPNFVSSPTSKKKQPASLPQQQPTPMMSAPYQTPRTGGGSRSTSGGNPSIADTILLEQWSEVGGARGSSNLNNKRRRLSGPYHRPTPSRQSSVMSAISNVPGMAGKLSLSGPGPYPTPRSGDFGAYSEGMNISNADAESWKGVGEDDEVLDVSENEGPNIVGGVEFEDDEALDEFEDEEDDDDA